MPSFTEIHEPEHSEHKHNKCVSPPPLTPAHHLAKTLNVSAASNKNILLPHSNGSISWENLCGQQKEEIKILKQSIADSGCEIQCLKSTIVAANEIILSKEDEINQLQDKLAFFEAETNILKLELAEMKKNDEKQQDEMKRSQMLIAESEENRASSSVTHSEPSVESNQTATDDFDEMPVKKRRKTTHKCLNCAYSTVKAYHMKIHRQEGCQKAIVTKDFSCSVCNAKFTYNTLRYHLNQYTKQSSHAQNGHQQYSPAQHREMLQKLKQSKH